MPSYYCAEKYRCRASQPDCRLVLAGGAVKWAGSCRNGTEEEKMSEYFRKVGVRRIVIMMLGNVILSLGVSIFKLSGLGNDPFSGMVMALSERSGMGYATFLILVNLVLFVIELLWGRKLIGIGTVVNAFLTGYMVTFFYGLCLKLAGVPEHLWQSVIWACVGVVICSLGVSLYQTPDVGVAPYDSLSLIMAERWTRISYFWHRMFIDAVCAVVCWLTGGIVGLGTLLCAFGLGPFIHFFNVHISEKLLENSRKSGRT